MPKVEQSAAIRELLVLNDLARRLASLRRPDEVLREVAVQARRLLGVDVAYIMLLREDSWLRIEVAEGSVGAFLPGIELAPGVGLGGQVIATGRPVQSESYLTDTQFAHEGTLDHAASAEQLTGLLGVPLVIDDTPIGVLFAADRHPRRFVTHEIELLAALASHAALAIRNATLFDQLEAANRELEDTLLARQRATELREALTAAVLTGGGTAAVLSPLAEGLGAPVWFYDVHDASSDPAAPAWRDLSGGPSAAELFSRERPTATVASWTHDGRHHVAVRVDLPSGYVGCLALRGSEEIVEADARSLSVGATAIALVIASERSVAEAELRIRGEFVHALLSPTADEASVRRRARASGADVDKVRTVLVFEPGPDDGAAAVRAARPLAARLAEELGGWSAEHDGRMVAFLQERRTERVTTRLTALTDGRLPCAAGVAPTTGGIQSLRESYETARTTAAVLDAMGRPRDCLAASELGVYRSLFSQAGRNDVAAFITATIGPLVMHDRERGRDLCTTLSTFLEQGQHHANTCAALHIHVNTLYQRLDRVTQVLGDGWRDPGRLLEIQIALTMRRLLERLSEAEV